MNWILLSLFAWIALPAHAEQSALERSLNRKVKTLEQQVMGLALPNYAVRTEIEDLFKTGSKLFDTFLFGEGDFIYGPRLLVQLGESYRLQTKDRAFDDSSVGYLRHLQSQRQINLTTLKEEFLPYVVGSSGLEVLGIVLNSYFEKATEEEEYSLPLLEETTQFASVGFELADGRAGTRSYFETLLKLFTALQHQEALLRVLFFIQTHEKRLDPQNAWVRDLFDERSEESYPALIQKAFLKRSDEKFAQETLEWFNSQEGAHSFASAASDLAKGQAKGHYDPGLDPFVEHLIPIWVEGVGDRKLRKKALENLRNFFERGLRGLEKVPKKSKEEILLLNWRFALDLATKLSTNEAKIWLLNEIAQLRNQDESVKRFLESSVLSVRGKYYHLVKDALESSGELPEGIAALIQENDTLIYSLSSFYIEVLPKREAFGKLAQMLEKGLHSALSAIRESSQRLCQEADFDLYLGALSSSNPPVRVAAVTCLSEIDEVSGVIPILRNTFERDPSIDVRLRSVSSLSRRAVYDQGLQHYLFDQLRKGVKEAVLRVIVRELHVAILSDPRLTFEVLEHKGGEALFDHSQEFRFLEKDTPFYIHALSSRSQYAREMGAMGLMALPEVSTSVPILMSLLEKEESYSVLKRVIEWLCRFSRKDQRVREFLFQQFENSKNRFIRLELTSHLPLSFADLDHYLEVALEDEESIVSEALLRMKSYGTTPDSPEFQEAMKKVIPRLIDFLKSTSSESLKVATVEVFAAYKEFAVPAIPALIELYFEFVEIYQWQTYSILASVLGRIGFGNYLDQKENQDLRRKLLKTLLLGVNRRGKDAEGALLALMSMGKHAVSTIPHLIERGDYHPAAQIAAQAENPEQELSQIVDPVLLNASKLDTVIHLKTVKCFGRLAAPLIPRLIENLGRRDLRSPILDILRGELGRIAVPQLLEALKHPDSGVREGAKAALSQITEESSSPRSSEE